MQSDIKLINGSHLLVLNTDDIIKSGFLNMVEISPYQDENRFLREAYIQSKFLPKIFHEKIYDFIYNTNDFGVLLLTGLPLDNFTPDTPDNPLDYPDKGGFLAELWLAAIAENLGGPIAYKQEKNGHIFQNIMPVKNNEMKLSSESSRLLLDFHTEVAFHPHKADYVILLCIRPVHEHQAKTFSASVRMIIKNLTAEDVATLSKPIFKTGMDYSFGSENGKKGNGACVSVLYGNPADPYLLYDLDLMQGMTECAEAALNRLRDAAYQVTVWTVLAKGDMLIIDNNRVVHGRSEFIAQYDGKDRWLMHPCAMRSLLTSYAERGNSRVIKTEFAV